MLCWVLVTVDLNDARWQIEAAPDEHTELR